MIKVIFLGTNGWYDSKTGNTLCTLIETESFYIILDAGNGIFKLDRYIKKPKPIYLFLSHVHLDHIIGIHTLEKFQFKQTLNFYCPERIRKDLLRIIRKPYTLTLSKLPFKVRMINVGEGSFKSPFSFSCKKLLHPVPCFGFRFELEDKIITYCTDTGLCRNAVWLARKADLLIAESSYKPGEVVKHWPHLNPQQAAGLAKKAKAKKLVLTHFDAARYLNIRQRKNAQRLAQGIFKNTLSAVDGLIIKI